MHQTNKQTNTQSYLNTYTYMDTYTVIDKVHVYVNNACQATYLDIIEQSTREFQQALMKYVELKGFEFE